MPVEYRIKNVTMGLMIGLAILFDAIQILLTITVIGSLFSFLITILAGLIFALWFALHGESVFKGNTAKKSLTVMATAIVELIPFIDAIPTITVGTASLILQSRKEDREKAVRREQERQKEVAMRVQQARIRQAQAAQIQAANDNAIQAANDNAVEEAREAA